MSCQALSPGFSQSGYAMLLKKSTAAPFLSQEGRRCPSTLPFSMAVVNFRTVSGVFHTCELENPSAYPVRRLGGEEFSEDGPFVHTG